LAIKLAAYGTLRNGSNNIGLIANTSLVYPGHQRFPAMIYNEHASGTIVEVQCIDSIMLANYDVYEGVAAGVYRRVEMQVAMDDGSITTAWVYLAGDKLLAQSDSFKEIASGDWFNR
jgi:gamma-glutamylcyclotransferase (GGCT)/AIG2-like uncharacterized protein YtfP